MRSLWFLLFGGGLIALGVWQYYDLTAYEAGEGTRELHWLLAWLYNDMGGKWPVVIFLAGVGALLALTGLASLVWSRRPAT